MQPKYLTECCFSMTLSLGIFELFGLLLLVNQTQDPHKLENINVQRF